MPIKSRYDGHRRTLPMSATGYASGFQQYPINFWLCTLLLFLVELGCAILAAPSPMLLETAVCRYHFEKGRQLLNGEPADEFCRSKEVQVHFAFVITVLSTLSTLAATMMQVPMGLLGDKGGLRLAFLLNATSTIFYWGCIAIVGMTSLIALEVGLLILIGSQQNLPLWSFYLSPVFVLLGGGPWVTGTLVFAAVSDSVKPEQRHAPTSSFSTPELTWPS
ncbi:unnamed protein product [Fusarium fujikuroi]|nr:unnamed protein product [Fusarium fujikuroi]VZI08792.1 unnamed protein product [Fusarium fujikuroi]